MAVSKSRLVIQELDGAPSGRPITLKVSNGTLTDNGDGTFSLDNSGAGGGATTALDNLAAVQINSSLLFDTDATYDIGTTTVGINDLHLGLAGVINFDGGDVTLTHGANTLTFAC